MKYHNITHDDMLNGDGLRVVLWVSGCSHHCPECQNPITWNCNIGLEFNHEAEKEIFDELEKDYISGITLSGGDPLHKSNIKDIFELCKKIKDRYNNKTIWLYTGYTWEQIMDDQDRKNIISLCDVLVDGRFEKDKADINYHWAGSTNQRVINVQKSLKCNNILLHN